MTRRRALFRQENINRNRAVKQAVGEYAHERKIQDIITQPCSTRQQVIIAAVGRVVKDPSKYLNRGTFFFLRSILKQGIRRRLTQKQQDTVVATLRELGEWSYD